MEGGVGDGVAGLGIPLLDGEGALVMVDLGDGDGLLALQILGVHVDAHRGAVHIEGRGGKDLAELVVPLYHVADSDGAVRLGFLGGDDLAVPEDKKNSASQRTAALIHLLQLDAHFRAVLKDEAHIMLAVPDEGLLHLGDVGAEDEPLRGSDFLGQKAAQGQVGEIQILL